VPLGEGLPVLPCVSGDGRWLSVSYLSLPGKEALPFAAALKPIEAAVRLWRLPSNDKPHDIRATALPIAQALSPDNRYLAIGYSDNSAELWDLASAEQVLHLHTSLRLITHVAFAPDGSALALCDVQSPPRIIHLRDLRRQLAKLGLDW
jgi:WD40 repeat protein